MGLESQKKKMAKKYLKKSSLSLEMIISVDAENAFNEIQCVLMIKILENLWLMGTNLNIVKAVYKKLTANAILNGVKSGSDPLSQE